MPRTFAFRLLPFACCLPLFCQKPVDPAAWGSNHAGQDVPEYVHGDECLFCHRDNIGPGWSKNVHNLTVRQAEDAPELKAIVAAEAGLAAVGSQIDYFLGSRHHIRFLHKEGYGTFALLSTRVSLGPDAKTQSRTAAEKPVWDPDRFAARCAGCHTTGVDSKTRQFTAFGLDCYVCHGVVSPEHTKDTSVIWLAKKHANDALSVTSICAQCHLRGSHSRSSGLPYPDNFVAGDNLFQDYQADFAKADDPSLNAGDRHVWRNVREVVMNGGTTTCLSCHRVHEQSTSKHRFVLTAPICADCHNATGPKKAVKAYTIHSQICEY
ncbi:MAG TPA: multiheme c-type cytochrome [Bryobacteraceae bacterium]|nr:multiheme c-type cytochrome [Bryobacteraceae bacterium]